MYNQSLQDRKGKLRIRHEKYTRFFRMLRKEILYCESVQFTVPNEVKTNLHVI